MTADVLKDSLENVLEFLEKKRVVLYHQEQMASEVRKQPDARKRSL